MHKKEWLQRLIMSYFIIVTCVNLVMAVLGLCYDSQIRFGYEAFLLPLIYGVVGVIPVLVTYSRRELTIKQMVVRRILQIVLLEVMLTGFVFGNARMREATASQGTLVAAFMITVLLVCVMVELVLWGLDCLKARALNLELKEFQSMNQK